MREDCSRELLFVNGSVATFGLGGVCSHIDWKGNALLLFFVPLVFGQTFSLTDI